MITEADFQNLYETVLTDELRSLESLRIKIVKKFNRNLSTGGIFFIISLLFLVFLSYPLIVVSVFLVGLGFVGTALGGTVEPLQNIKSQYKHKIILQVLNFMFRDFEYIPRQKLNNAIIYDSMLLNMIPGSITGEDYLKFRIGETSVHLCEIRTYNRSDEGRAAFKGMFISAGFNKNFTSKTIVLSRKYTNIRRKIKLFLLAGNKKVILEDPVFNKSYLVFTDDQVEARYILSTSFMERILAFRARSGKDLSFSFVNNRMYMIIPEKVNLFEYTVFGRVDRYQEVKASFDYFRLISDIVYELDLNKRIWSKK